MYIDIIPSRVMIYILSPSSVVFQIKARPVVREVIATYTMDDITADLIINIANK